MIGNDAIDALFKRVVEYLDSVLPERTTLTFEGAGVSCADDPVGERTRVIIPGGLNDATTTEKGKIKLAGDLTGTADIPRVVRLTGGEYGILYEDAAAAQAFNPASAPHGTFLSGRLELAVNATTTTVSMLPMSGDPCVVRCTAEVLAKDLNFETTTYHAAVPVAVFRWNGTTLTLIDGGDDPSPVESAGFAGHVEWIADGSTIKLQGTAAGNVRFGIEFRLVRLA